MAVDLESAAKRQAREFAEKSIRRLREHLRKLTKEGVSPIVIGGWAVAAHGSPIGSRDVDALIRMEDQRAVGEALGNQDFVAGHLEEDSALDYDFLEKTNRSNVGYPVRFDYEPILKNHVSRKQVKAGAVSLTISVPDATTLLFLKAKAFADRSFAYYAQTHPAELKKLSEDAQDYVKGRDLEYWGWKAAKDMDDLAFLADLELDRKRLSRLLDDSNLRKYAVREWARRDKDLVAIADGIRENHGEPTGFVDARFGKVLDLLTG